MGIFSGGYSSTAASISRLRSARNRIAGAITACLRAEASDCSHWGSGNPELQFERQALERARDLLVERAPERLTNEERYNAAAAQRDFATMGASCLRGERSHGENFDAA